jgi:lysozyme
MNVAGARVFALIQTMELLRLVAFQNPGDVPTIAWGHTAGVKLGDTCTRAQADAWLAEDVANAARYLNIAFPSLTQGRFDALTDFIYQFGLSKFIGSTLFRYLRLSRWDDAANQLPRWVYANHKQNARMELRRATERGWFTNG